MKKALLLSIALVCSIMAYEENFNSYKNGTPLKNLTTEGISYSASGSWEIFTAPFANFTTPVLLEPGKTSSHAPLSLRFAAPQCRLRLTYATDGQDSLVVTGTYNGSEVYRSSFKGSYADGLYSKTIDVGAKVDSVTLTTAGGKKLLIDDIHTEACTLDTFALTDGLIGHHHLEENSALGASDTSGIIGGAIDLSTMPQSSILEYPSKGVQSFAFWLHTSEASAGSTFLSVAQSSARMTLSLTDSHTIGLSLPESFFSPFSAQNPLTTQQWHHIALIKEHDTISLYIDGKIAETFTTSATLHQAGEAISLEPASGLRLDDLRLYERALSAAEVQELFYVRDNFTAIAEDRFEAGKHYCMENPEACGLRPGRGELDLSIAADVASLANQTFSFGWYLFSSSDGSTYLAGGDFSNPHIWQLVPGTREWKPVHNADAFDGFEGREAIFDSVLISKNGTEIVFGSAIDTNLPSAED